MIYPGQRTRAEAVLQQVAQAYGVAVADIRARARDAYIVQARAVAVYLVRQHVELSTMALGEFLDRDHTTIMNALKKAPRYLETREAKQALAACQAS